MQRGLIKQLILIFLIIAGFSKNLLSQSSKKNSENEMAVKNDDLREAARSGDSINFFKFFNAYKKEAKFNKDYALLINCYSNLGVYFYYRNEMINAIKSFDSTCIESKRHNKPDAYATGLMNRGASYYTSKQYAFALRDYLEAEKTMKELKNIEIGGLQGNIALLYSEIGDLKNAKLYLFKSFQFTKTDSTGEAMAKFYNNLGMIYKKEKNYFSADSVYEIGMDIARKNSLKRDLSDLLYNRMVTLNHLKKYEEAIILNEELYEESVKDGDVAWLKMIILNLAELNVALKRNKEAEKYLKEAENIAWPTDLEYDQLKKDYYSTTAEVYVYFKKYDRATEAFRKALALETSGKVETEIANLHQLKFNAERQQDSIAFAKEKEIEHILNEKEKQEAEHKLSQQRIIIGVSIIGIIIIIIFSGSLLKANRSKEKANTELKEQKKIVSEKNKEITDSITYSKQIQQSLLPKEIAFKKYFPQHFLIYKPKDIVSGDFYWLRENIKKEIFIAVADCTGHGVPGAIMSALSIQQLNNISRIVAEPGEVLQELNKKIKQNLNQDEVGFSKDGLDICLCKINVAQKKLYYSGANRSLMIFNARGLKLEIKGTKAGIGGHTSNDQIYAEHEIKIEAGDYFVMTTDGFADQFGGDKQKKITTKHFKQWVCETSKDNFENKGEELKERFIKWKNNAEQIDDVCVLGFKFE